MNEDAGQVDHPQALVVIERRPIFSSTTAPLGARFSAAVSGLCAGVLLIALGAILWFSATLPKLDRFADPDHALEWMVSRTMEARDGLQQAPPWQQWLVEWGIRSDEAQRVEVVRWYQEVVQTTNDPLSKLRLAILQGEFGHEQVALDVVGSWKDLASPMPAYGQLIEAAYGLESLDQELERDLQSTLAEALPTGWFYNHLAARLAERANNQARLATVERDIVLRGTEVQARSNLLIEFEIACLLVGSVVLVRMVQTRNSKRDEMWLLRTSIPPAWPGEIGAAVLLRGGALAAILTVAFLSFAPLEHVALRALVIPLANLPLLALAYVYLLKPTGLNFWDSFGLYIERRNLRPLAGAVLAVFAAGLWGEWVIGRVAESLRLTNHWTEWFDPNLIWAPRSVMIVSLLEYVVLAPIFEELAFRGLLFASLRRRFSFMPAAAISAAVFSIAHGYALIGFASVFWSGFLWAWIYEKTGSLLPGMIAHVLNNLLVCVAVMALLRV